MVDIMHLLQSIIYLWQDVVIDLSLSKVYCCLGINYAVLTPEMKVETTYDI